MAWNPSPEVAVAREAAKKLGAEQVVVVFIKADSGQFGMASYGETKALCAEAGKLGDALFDRARKWLADN